MCIVLVVLVVDNDGVANSKESSSHRCPILDLISQLQCTQ